MFSLKEDSWINPQLRPRLLWFSSSALPQSQGKIKIHLPRPDSRHWGKYRNIFPKCSPIVSIHTPLLLLLPVAVSPVWPENFLNDRSGWLLRSLLSDVWEAWFGILKICIFNLDKLDYLAYPDHHDILIILVKMVLPGSSSPRLSATPF